MIVIIWLLHTVSFVWSLVLRKRKKKPLSVENGGVIQKEVRVNKWVNIFCLIVLFYLIVIRLILRWQLRVDLFVIYVLYLLFFSFLDYAFNLFGFRINKDNARPDRRKSAYRLYIKRNIYLPFRITYLCIGWIAFIFLPGLFIESIMLQTPDSGLHNKLDTEGVGSNTKQVYTKYIDYREYYDLNEYPFFEYNHWHKKVYSYSNRTILEMNYDDQSVVIYYIKLFFFKQKWDVLSDVNVYDDTRPPQLLGTDSFFIRNDDQPQQTSTARDTVYGELIYRPKGDLMFKDVSAYIKNNY